MRVMKPSTAGPPRAPAVPRHLRHWTGHPRRRVAGHGAAVMAAALLLLPAPAPAAGQDVSVEIDLLSLVQIPVAVARVQAAGVPLADVRMLVPALFDAGLSPSEILGTLRVLPATRERDIRWGTDDREFDGEARGSSGMGAYVQHLHDRGLRGRELAEAIHAELRRGGIPAGGPGHGDPGDRMDGQDRYEARTGVLERGFFPGVEEDDFVRGRGAAPGARGKSGKAGAGPAGKGRPDAKGPPAARGGEGAGGGAGSAPGNRGKPGNAKGPRPGGGTP